MSLNKIDYEATKNIPIPIGVGQTWQNLGGSRSTGTTYTNTTGRAICISVRMTILQGTITDALVNGNIITSFANNGTGGNTWTHFVIVPPGATYRINTGSISGWWELR